MLLAERGAKCAVPARCSRVLSSFLLESFSYGRVGGVDLLVDRAGGGELLPVVRSAQVPLEVCQGLRDGEVPVF